MLLSEKDVENLMEIQRRFGDVRRAYEYLEGVIKGLSLVIPEERRGEIDNLIENARKIYNGNG